jgi:hypothetical protein
MDCLLVTSFASFGKGGHLLLDIDPECFNQLGKQRKSNEFRYHVHRTYSHVFHRKQLESNSFDASKSLRRSS